MKIGKIVLMLVLLLGLMGINLLVEGQDADDYGKLTGWILDPDSGKPVDEVFVIDLFNCVEFESQATLFRHRETNKNGYFSIEINPGQYCMHISPKSLESKYCIEPYHFENDQFNFPIMIEKGKITHIRKKATPGGAIKVRVLDTGGKLVIPSTDLGKKAEISVSIYSSNYIIGSLRDHYLYDEMNDGETTIRTLYPSPYEVSVSFYRTGYKTLTYENVPVKENEVTGIDFVIDVNDITGIEGRVLDINGTPSKGIKVTMIPQFSVSGDFYDITDENGHFRITGLTEGLYKIMLSSTSRGILRTIKGNVEIKKDILLKKDIQID
jgi:hypothetical protein